ncbi:MAG: DsbA family protein, partial [Sciscionella sp.]
EQHMTAPPRSAGETVEVFFDFTCPFTHRAWRRLDNVDGARLLWQATQAPARDTAELREWQRVTPAVGMS